MLVNQPTLNAYQQPQAAAGTYSERQQSRKYDMAKKVALGAADVYVAGATAMAPAGSTLSTIMPWMSGAAGVFHAIQGFAALKWYPDASGEVTSQARAMGTGNLITAGGFGALAFGFGIWALPIIAIGQITCLAGQHFGRDSA